MSFRILPTLILCSAIATFAAPAESAHRSDPFPTAAAADASFSNSSQVSEELAPDSGRLAPEDERLWKAYAWSIGGTAVPLAASMYLSANSGGQYDVLVGALALTGLFVGPSMGQFYADSYGRGSLGIGIRTTGGFLGILGAAVMLGDALCGMDGGEEEHSCGDDSNRGGTLFVVGGLTYLGGALYSLFDTGYAVKRQSERRQASRIELSPTLARDPSGGLRGGALAWVHF